MKIQNFYDKDTATFTYVVSDEKSVKCAIIDPVLDFDFSAAKISHGSSDKIIDYVKANNLEVEWILETHVHADHLTGSSYLKEKLGGKIGIAEKITDVLKYWVPVFNTAKDTPLDGSQFDHLFADGEKFKIGSLEVRVMHTPGHTPACAAYLIEDAAFVGDTIFTPKMGTARTDFPGGSAAILFDSIQKIYALGDEVRIFIGHDYPENGAEPRFMCSVAEQKQSNILVNSKISKAEYVETRNKRDVGKTVPRLLLPSLQINLRAGKFGESESNGKQYVKLPLS
ncbi:MAG: MBL fold metallo-hydrolase [Proteobacteria bacterium]|nr:MBL fold metallo-hydrolase [Pseudomonadota bacterium]